jgi:hypothetical protein
MHVTDKAGLREFQLMGNSRVVMRLDIGPMKNPGIRTVPCDVTLVIETTELTVVFSGVATRKS